MIRNSTHSDAPPYQTGAATDAGQANPAQLPDNLVFEMSVAGSGALADAVAQHQAGLDGWDFEAWDNRLRPGWGWPIWVPSTSESSYITGLSMLGLPSDTLSAWSPANIWWCWRFVDHQGRRMAPMLSTDLPHNTLGILGQEGISDIRGRLRGIEHPAGWREEPVIGADHPRAIVDMAWACLHSAEQSNAHIAPCSRMVGDWCTPDDVQNVRRMAGELLGQSTLQSSLALRWGGWAAELDVPDAGSMQWDDGDV